MVSAQKLKGSLKRSFLPEVKLSYGRERYTTGPYHSVNQPYGGIEAEVNVFNSGRDSLEDKRRNKDARLSEVSAAIVKADILAEAKKTLANYAFLKETQAILKESITINEKNILDAQKRINAGLTSKTDLLDFKQLRITLAQDYQTLSYDLGVSSRNLAVLMGLEPKTILEINFQNSHPDHSASLGPAPQNSNSKLLQKATLALEIAVLEKEVASRWWTPKLDLYGYALRFTRKEREYREPEQSNDFSIGFKFTFPVFDGGEGSAQASSKSALAQANELQVRQRELEVHNDVYNAIKKLELAHSLIHGAEDSVKLMNEYRSEITKEYIKGIKNSPDVLQANERWISAYNKYAEIKRNYQVARVEAEYLLSLME
jgi:outer membrane protein TolC